MWCSWVDILRAERRPGLEQGCEEVSARGQSRLGRASVGMAQVCDFVRKQAADACPNLQFKKMVLWLLET